MDRRTYLRSAAGVTTASLLAGCEGLPLPGDGGGGENGDNGQSSPQLSTGLLIPTVALETTVDGEQTWVPREVNTRRGGGDSGWQIPLLGGDNRWSPSGDRGDFEFDLDPTRDKQDVSPPDWFPDAADFNLQNDYYRIPCQHFASTGNGEAPVDYPNDIAAEMHGGSSTIGDGFPTDGPAGSSSSDREMSMILEMRESRAGSSARHIGTAGLSTSFQSDGRFFEAAQVAPAWEGNGNAGTLTTTSANEYGAILTARDTLQASLKRGYEQLNNLHTFITIIFTAGIGAVSSSGSPLVRFAMEGAKSYVNEQGYPTGKKTLLVESLSRGIARITGYVSDGEAVQLSDDDQPPDPEILNNADAVTASVFIPPLNESMANADWELEDTAGNTGVDYARVGIGLSGPVVVLNGSSSSKTPVPRSNASAEFTEVSLTAPEGIVFGSEATMTVSARNAGQTDGTYTDTLSLAEGATEFSEEVSFNVPRGQTASTDVPFRPAVADTYRFELEEAGESATVEVAANFGTVGSSLQINDFPVPADAVGFLSEDDGLRATLTDVNFQQSVFFERERYAEPAIASLNDQDRLFVAFLFEFENTGSREFEVPQEMFELGESARLLDGDVPGSSDWYGLSNVRLPYGRVEGPARLAAELELAPGQRQEAFLLGVIGTEAARGFVELEAQNDAPDTPPEWTWSVGSDIEDRPLPQYELVSLDAPDTHGNTETFEVTASVRNTGDGDGTFRGELQYRPTYNNEWDRVIPASPERVFREIGAGETAEVSLEVNTVDSAFVEYWEVYRLAPFWDRSWTIPPSDSLATDTSTFTPSHPATRPVASDASQSSADASDPGASTATFDS